MKNAKSAQSTEGAKLSIPSAIISGFQPLASFSIVEPGVRD
jgi:hypothetical protein